jgi:hypothetical protein
LIVSADIEDNMLFLFHDEMEDGKVILYYSKKVFDEIGFNDGCMKRDAYEVGLFWLVDVDSSCRSFTKQSCIH